MLQSISVNQNCNMLWCMGTVPYFYAIFSKGNNCDFLFASLDNTALIKWGIVLRNLLPEEQILP